MAKETINALRKLLRGSQDPTVLATFGLVGDLFMKESSPIKLFQKQTNGLNTLWSTISATGLYDFAKSRVYPVYDGGPFTTIQSAIDQAVIDGASSSNLVVVLVHPKIGGYTEDVVLADGILLSSAGNASGYNILLNGSITCAPTTGLQNTGSISGFNIVSPVGVIPLTIGGTAPLEFYVDHVQAHNSDGTVPNYQQTNQQAQVSFEIGNKFEKTVATGIILDVQAGKCNFLAISGYEGGETALKIGTTAEVGMKDCIISSRGLNDTIIIDGSLFLLQSLMTQAEPSSPGILVNATGTLITIGSLFSVNAPNFVVHGTGVFAYSTMTFTNSIEAQSTLTSIAFGTAPSFSP